MDSIFNSIDEKSEIKAIILSDVMAKFNINEGDNITHSEQLTIETIAEHIAKEIKSHTVERYDAKPDFDTMLNVAKYLIDIDINETIINQKPLYNLKKRYNNAILKINDEIKNNKIEDLKKINTQGLNIKSRIKFYNEKDIIVQAISNQTSLCSSFSKVRISSFDLQRTIEIITKYIDEFVNQIIDHMGDFLLKNYRLCEETSLLKTFIKRRNKHHIEKVQKEIENGLKKELLKYLFVGEKSPVIENIPVKKLMEFSNSCFDELLRLKVKTIIRAVPKKKKVTVESLLNITSPITDYSMTTEPFLPSGEFTVIASGVK